MVRQLAVCAEMLWLDKPLEWRISRLTEMGFSVGLWNWPDWDLSNISRLGATFTTINGYLEGRLADDAGAELLLKSATQTIQIGKKLGVQQYNLHGTGLGDTGLPIPRPGINSPVMWPNAIDTLNRICDLAEAEGVVFVLENLNLLDHPGCLFNSTRDVLSLIAAVNRPQLRMNLDLYHTQIGEGDVIRWTRACLPFIREIQVADNPGRCEPGTGEMNWANIAFSIREMGYNGLITMEAYAKEDPMAALMAFKNIFDYP